MKIIKWILVVIGVLILVAIPFLWHEPLDFSKKINDQKFTNYFFVVLTVIGTGLTTFYLAKQVYLAGLGIRPDIEPESTVFTMKDNAITFNSEGLPITYAQRTDSTTDHINIYNSGIAIAKKIECKWEYNKEQVLALTKGVYFNGYEEVPQRISFLRPENTMVISASSFFMTCCGPELNPSLLDFIPPVKIDPKPELKLLIVYRDIQNNSYSKSFKTIIHAVDDSVTLSFEEI